MGCNLGAVNYFDQRSLMFSTTARDVGFEPHIDRLVSEEAPIDEASRNPDGHHDEHQTRTPPAQRPRAQYATDAMRTVVGHAPLGSSE
jgi:hypothetical protein